MTPPTDFSLDPLGCVMLYRLLELHAPRAVLELGSGFSTCFVQAYVERQAELERKVEHCALEESGNFVERTRQLMQGWGFSFKHAVPFLVGLNYKTAFYQLEDVPRPRGGYDFLFVDGPRGETGRVGFLSHVRGLLASNCLIVVDDMKRPGMLQYWENLKQEGSVLVDTQQPTVPGRHGIAVGRLRF